MTAPSRNELTIAVIGLLGVIFTGVVSNWDKIFSPTRNTMNPVISDDINVQFRYYVESSGFRASLEALEKSKAERYRLELKADPDTVNCMLDMGLQTTQLVDIAVNALKSHFTLEEIKELNRINANPVMIRLAEKQPAITLDAVKGLQDALERNKRRNMVLAGNNKTRGAQNPACPSP